MADLSPEFLVCLPDTLAQECPYPNDWSNPRNFSNDPHDPGGATMDGIIQSEYNQYCSENGLPYTSVRDITQPQGQTIYYQNYWLPRCPSLPIGLNLNYFDSSVNEGPVEAIKILQVALGISNDGIWGPQTAAAVLAITNVQDVIQLYTARRKIVYRETSGFQYFGTDWIRRATEIGQQSLNMASGSVDHTLMLIYGFNKSHKRPIRTRYYLEGLVS